MIEKLSQRILQYLLHSGVIEDTNDEKEYYQYGIEITISSILNVVLILGIGLITWNIFESLVFLLLFIPIRQFTGGFHAVHILNVICSFAFYFHQYLSYIILPKKFLIHIYQF